MPRLPRPVADGLLYHAINRGGTGLPCSPPPQTSRPSSTPCGKRNAAIRFGCSATASSAARSAYQNPQELQGTTVLLLNANDVRKALPMREAIEAMKGAFAA